MAQLKQISAKLPDGQLKTFVDADIYRAQRDIFEDDQEECAGLLNHAARLLATMH